MLYRKPVLTIATLVLILVFLFLNIGSDISVKNNYSFLATLGSNYNKKNSESVSQMLNELQNSTIDEIQFRVDKTDEYLRRISKLKSSQSRTDSRMIFASDVNAMTQLTINQMPCSDQFGKDLTLIVMVFNRVDDFDRRQTIRETWGRVLRDNSKTRLYFSFGLTQNPSIQKRIEEENQEFADILQFGYYESYYKCTIKAIGLLRWTALNCPYVKFMLKVDDDSLILPNNLIQYCDTSASDSILGYLWRKPFVRRGSDKWSISREDYPSNQYPDYIGGPYLIPGPAALALYETAITNSLPAIPFEDVHITGVVAEKCMIPRKHLTSLLYLSMGCQPTELDYCFYQNYTIFWQNFDNKALRKVWNDFQNDRICQSKEGKRC